MTPSEMVLRHVHQRAEYFDIASPKRHILCLDSLIPVPDCDDLDLDYDPLVISFCDHIPDLHPLFVFLTACLEAIILIAYTLIRPWDIATMIAIGVLTNLLHMIIGSIESVGSAKETPCTSEVNDQVHSSGSYCPCGD